MQTQKLNNDCNQLKDEPANNRRQFLKSSISACALLALPLGTAQSFANVLLPTERKLAFLNLHTGERIQSTYWAEGKYIPEALQAIRNVLRDHRSGNLHTMDTELFNLLHVLHSRLNAKQEFHVISAYRSPKSNAMLAGRSDGVAKQSLHTQGKAIDIRLPEHQLTDLRAAALSLKVGGVGYYPKSDFIHIDTGRTRSWGG